MPERNAFTEKLLATGLKTGMRVLDIGCGQGEVSALALDLVGDSGEVYGVDRNEEAIAAAKEAYSAPNLHFFVADLNEDLPVEGKFDALIGRRVLMYLPAVRATLAHLKKYLKTAGLYLFQESDATLALAQEVALPKMQAAQEAIWQTVAYEGGDIHIGSHLHGLIKQLDMEVVWLHSENDLQTKETGTDLPWLLDVMAERLTAVCDIRDLTPEALEEELAHSTASFVRDTHVGIVAQRK